MAAGTPQPPAYNEPESEKKMSEHEAFERFNIRKYKLANFADEIYKLKSELNNIPETIAQENRQKEWIKAKLYPLHGRIGYFIQDFLKPR